jgi:hypothetical protein
MNDEKEQSDAQTLYDNQVNLQKQIDEQVALNQNQAQQLEQLQKQSQKRTLPASELDLNLMLTDTMWGNPSISPIIKDKLNKQYIVEDSNGVKYVSKEDMWGLLGFYTRDLRLGNLSNFGGEMHYCEYHLDLANDLLKEGFTEPFLIVLSRVATKLELSQSKGGFLRRRNSSFTTENVNQNIEPAKRTIMGSKVQQQ